MKKKILSMILIFIFAFSSIALADAEIHEAVISLGKNLSEEQRKQMLYLFGADENTKIIEVTNEEEREYLGKHIDEKLLGTRAISSAYVEKLPEGEGITVESKNITWVTNDMYRNAIVTAGIKDAKIIVAAPFEVSGTAALTGIMKAFEDLTGEEITEKNVRSIRPGFGLHPKYYKEILGKKVKEDLEKGERFLFENI